MRTTFLINLVTIVLGAAIAVLALQGVGWLSGRWILITLTPYISLFIVAGLVWGLHARPPARKAALTSSLFVTGTTAFIYGPLNPGGGGCMTSVLFVFGTALLLPAVLVTYGLAFCLFRFAWGHKRA